MAGARVRGRSDRCRHRRIDACDEPTQSYVHRQAHRQMDTHTRMYIRIRTNTHTRALERTDVCLKVVRGDNGSVDVRCARHHICLHRHVLMPAVNVHTDTFTHLDVAMRLHMHATTHLYAHTHAHAHAHAPTQTSTQIHNYMSHLYVGHNTHGRISITI